MVKHVNALGLLDFHQGARKVLTSGVDWSKSMLLGVIEDCSHQVCYLQWYLDESATCMIYGLCQAFTKRGLTYVLMTDKGASMLAAESTIGLASLGVLHQMTLRPTRTPNRSGS